MAPKPVIRSQRYDVPQQFHELAQRRTEFLFHVMTWGDKSMRIVLASAYLQGLGDAADALEKRLESARVPDEEAASTAGGGQVAAPACLPFHR